MAKPDLLKWVSDDDANKIEDPGTTKKLNGFLYKEKPPFQFVNYLFNRIFKWLRGLQGNYADVVVGSASQVSAYEATHTVNQLNDAAVPAGSRVLILQGTHVLTGNVALTNANLTFEIENELAIIDGDSQSFTMTISGANVSGKLRPQNLSAPVAVTGTGSGLETRPHYRTGTFTATLVGFVGVVTGTIHYFVRGGIVTLVAPNAITGVSNADTFKISGIPDFLQIKGSGSTPGSNTNYRMAACLVINNGIEELLMAQLREGFVGGDTTTIGFLRSNGTEYAENTFTASGTKGLPQFWTFMYSLGD